MYRFLNKANYLGPYIIKLKKNKIIINLKAELIKNFSSSLNRNRLNAKNTNKNIALISSYKKKGKVKFSAV